MLDPQYCKLSADMIIASYNKASLDKTNIAGVIKTVEIDYTSIYLIKDTMFIPIPGTENWKDILIDAKVHVKKTLEGAVHSGAWERYTAYIPLIEILLKEYKPKKLIISGHSMGAWVASLLAARYVLSFGKDNIKLNLFASPHLGDLTYTVYFKELGISTCKFTNPYDIVPKAPIGLWPIGIDTKVDFPHVLAVDILGNHSMDNYRLSLDKVYPL